MILQNFKNLMKSIYLINKIFKKLLENSVTLRKIVYVIESHGYLHNYLEIIMFLLKLKSKINIVFKNGYTLVNFKRENWKYLLYYINAFSNDISFQNKGSDIIANIKNFKLKLLDAINGIYQINEIFIRGSYDKINYNNKTVLDIGGFIGDSALFFLLKGAEKVIAYEINKKSYKVLKENIRINQLENVIIAYNYGVADTFQKGTLKLTRQKGMSSLYFNDNNTRDVIEEIEVNLIPISEVLKNPIDILKIDCEGCEYRILEGILEKNLSGRIREGLILESHNLDSKRNSDYAKLLLKSIGFRKISSIKNSELTEIIYATRFD